MSTEINRYAINDLIEFYQKLNEINISFNDKNPTDSTNANYLNLIEQLIVVKEFLINKSFDEINAIYRPTENLFIYKEHYAILDNTVQFFKLNVNEDYPIADTNSIEESIEPNDNTDFSIISPHLNDNGDADNNINNSLVQSCNELKNKIVAIEKTFESYLSQSGTNDDTGAGNITNQDILDKLSQVQESINSIMNQDSFQAISKKSQDTLTQMKTNGELVRSDLSKYDEFLTNHITKSSANVTEVVEKEYTRFVHRVSSDVSAIVAGITEANKIELATQTKLVQTSLDKFENKIDNKIESKFLKWFSIIFFGCAFLLFGASSLSSSWTGNKISNSAKLVKLSVTCKLAKPIVLHKAKIQTNNDEQID